jgi:hypothetical protein
VPQIIEHPSEWFARQGGDPVSSRDGLLFPSGARCDGECSLYSRLEPPDDPTQLLQVRNTYHSTKRNIFKTAFRQLKAALTDGLVFSWDIKRLGPPPSGAADDNDPMPGRSALLHLKAMYEKHAQAVVEIEEQIENTPERRAFRERQEREAASALASRERAERFKTEMQAIELEQIEDESNPYA